MGALDGEILVATLFENLSCEARRLASIASNLDGLMAAIAASAGRMTSDQVLGLQNIDALRQSLEAIAQITTLAAKSVPSDADFTFIRNDLANTVTVRKVRDGCLGPPSDIAEPHQTPKSDTDDTMIFDST